MAGQDRYSITYEVIHDLPKGLDGVSAGDAVLVSAVLNDDMTHEEDAQDVFGDARILTVPGFPRVIQANGSRDGISEREER